MIGANNIGLQFGSRKLFDGVSITFSPGNCYGLIGANGSGKSTFLKILSGEIESTTGEVFMAAGKRLSVLKQDQFAYDEYDVLTTVLMGHKKLFQVMAEKDAIYAKPDFSDADGIRASELEGEFAELDGWNAESDAGKMLSNVGITEEFYKMKMKQLEGSQKVKVLLAQALFGSPDILLLDEPTNHLDVETCMWLEDFLIDFENTAIVVSHDRHFLDKVCTHVCDIDFSKITLFPGNFSFWVQSSELALRQKQDSNKKIDERRKELQSFIARFSANASKSKQATSRKKILENLTLNDIKPSSRKYPYIGFESEREAGNDLLHIDHLSKSIDGQVMFKDFSVTIEKGDKVAFIGRNDLTKTTIFDILTKKIQPDEGTFKWGASTAQAYFPKENSEFFERDLCIIDWLRQYSKVKDEQYVRGFLGRMLFTGDESLKSVKVLSGGEKVRCMLSRMMLVQANVLIFDEPTNHLDLESISALNKGMAKFNGTILFSSHDHELVQTVANRIIEITPNGYIDKQGTTFDDYLADETIKKRREDLYHKNASV
ncbi:MAG: ATP-binding cassette domain-containing protein [Candidatus Omnitrophica bacterium]|nr:ATP-binding cassette domain-containing protein [Candidatus Omnitrophota bacterium]